MMPRPPIHCSRWRQKLSEGGSASRPVSTVEPVVVRPDIASKKPPVKDQARQRHEQRQGRGRRQQQPAERHQQEAVARLELAPHALGGRGDERQAGAGGEHGSEQELRPQAVAEPHRARQRRQTGEREGCEQESEDVRDRQHRG